MPPTAIKTEITPEPKEAKGPDLQAQLSDALAYTAELEKEIEALKAKTLPPGRKPPAGRGNRLPPVKKPLLPEHRGARVYIVGPKKAFTDRMYQPGELITLVDQAPSKDMRPADGEQVKAAAAPAPVAKPSGRSADQTVG